MTDKGKSNQDENMGKNGDQQSQAKDIRKDLRKYKPVERFGKSFNFKEYASYIKKEEQNRKAQSED